MCGDCHRLRVLPPDHPATPQERSKARPENQGMQQGGRNSIACYRLSELLIHFTCVFQKAPPEKSNCHLQVWIATRPVKAISVLIWHRRSFLAPAYCHLIYAQHLKS
jgi:hypothetical protein